MRKFVVALFCLLGTGTGVHADDTVTAAQARPGDAGIVDFDTLVVSGIQPGPGLWKIHHEGNVLWLLGTVDPLPRRMQWESRRVEAIVARSGTVIGPPMFSVGARANIFRRLALAPSLLRMRRNPDNVRLASLLDPGEHARWDALRSRYMPRNTAAERWRPIFAAQALYEAAIGTWGMTEDDLVGPLVRRTARRNNVEVTPAAARIQLEDPRAVLREFRATHLDDLECFRRTLDRIETDLEAMREHANAWATGDMEALRAASYETQYAACMRALTDSQLAREIGGDTLREQARQAWLDAAEKALGEHAESFSWVPLSLMLREETGLLVQMQSRGYRIEAPDDP